MGLEHGARTSGQRRRVGVAVGKFNPPHLGHLHLIETAAAGVEQLYVLLCDRPDQTYSAERRAAWLKDAAPENVTVLTTLDDLPAANEPWAERALALLPEPPDVAFTSEAWGTGWAQAMGADHVLVDLERTVVPVSATRLRNDLGAYFHYLVPAARADLSRRATLIGAESTGKTTLAVALARELGTVWVPEHGRWYAEGRMHVSKGSWRTDEFRRIAAAQRILETDLARLATKGIVIADTDALVTAVWHERYMGTNNPLLDIAIDCNVPDAYLICAPDFPWVQDGTRESGEQRQWMHESMFARARRTRARVEVLTGPHEQRLARALEVIESLMDFPALV